MYRDHFLFYTKVIKFNHFGFIPKKDETLKGVFSKNERGYRLNNRF